MSVHTPVVETQGSKADREQILYTYQRFLDLSSYLFKRSSKDSSIYNINEIPEDNSFYADAVKIAKQLKVNWKNMSHANSNRIMLALLEDYFQAMQDIEEHTSLDVFTKLVFKKNDTKNKA